MRVLLLSCVVTIAAMGCGRSGVLPVEDDRGRVPVPHLPGGGDGDDGEGARAIEVEWVRTYGAAGDDVANDVALGAGNVAVAGSFRGAIDFGDGVDTVTSGVDDAFVAVLTTGSGAYAWHAAGGGAANDVANAVAVHADGRVAIAGRAESASADFGMGTSPGSGDGKGDLFVAAYDAAGAAEWWDLSAFSGRDEAFSVTYTGYLFVGGDEDASVNDTDSFLERRDPVGGGIFASVNHQAPNANEHLRTTASDAGASVYLGGGYFTGTSTYAGLSVTAQGEDAIAYHVVTAGPVNWIFHLSGPGNERVTSIARANDGWVIAGEFEGTADVAEATLVSAGGTDVFVAVVDDDDGAIRWIRRFGGAGDDHLTGAGYALGLVQIAGTYSGAFDAGVELGLLPAMTQGSYLLSLDTTTGGKAIAASTIGGEGVRVTGLAVGPDANAYLSGSFAGETVFGAQPRASNGGTDAFVLRGRLVPESR